MDRGLHNVSVANAYRAISFEKEAYDNQYDFDYLKSRRRFAQWKKK